MVSNQLDVDLGANAFRRLSDAAVGTARDAVFQQRQDTVARLRTSISKMRDGLRRTSETLERSENNLTQLRSVLLRNVTKKTIPPKMQKKIAR